MILFNIQKMRNLKQGEMRPIFWGGHSFKYNIRTIITDDKYTLL